MTEIAKETPTSERPSQPNGNTNKMLDAIRAGLFSAGIEHDDLDYIARRVEQALMRVEPASGVPAIIRGSHPTARIVAEYKVHQLCNEWLTSQAAQNLAINLLSDSDGSLKHRVYEATSEFAAFETYKITLPGDVSLTMFCGLSEKEVS